MTGLALGLAALAVVLHLSVVCRQHRTIARLELALVALRVARAREIAQMEAQVRHLQGLARKAHPPRPGTFDLVSLPPHASAREVRS